MKNNFYSNFILENMFEGFVLCELIFNKNNNNYSYKVIYTNSAFEKIVNLQSTNLLGNYIEYIFEKLNYILNKNALDKIRNKQRVEIVYYYKRLNKTLKVKLIMVEEDKLGIFVEDITKRYKRCIKYSIGGEKFNKIFKESPVAMQLLSFQGKLLNVNKAFFQMFNVKNKKHLERFNVLRNMGLPSRGIKEKLNKGHVVKLQKKMYIRSFSNSKLQCSAGRYIQFTLIKLSGNGGILVQMQDMTKIKKSTDDILKLVNYDVLTDLPNRKYFIENLSKELEKSYKNNREISVIFMDLNEFKNINDTYGHDVGDLVLIEIARRLKCILEPDEVLARLGGDEFVLYKSFAKKETVNRFIERIFSIFKEPFVAGYYKGFISSSLGISMYPKDGKTVNKLIKNADIAMYNAKTKKGNQYEFFNEQEVCKKIMSYSNKCIYSKLGM